MEGSSNEDVWWSEHPDHPAVPELAVHDSWRVPAPEGQVAMTIGEILLGLVLGTVATFVTTIVVVLALRFMGVL
jgi:hypothetical protein